jgi:ATP-dependent RNA helicase DeaD
MDIRREQRNLAAGAHIVVGTPGRLADHLDQKHLDLSQIRAVVLDEADEMLDLGFRDELEELLSATPAERHTLMFSATLPKGILGLAKKYQKDALRLALSSEHEQHGDIEYKAFPIKQRDSEHAVVNTLRYFDSPGALVFCGTREAVRHLHANLQERGFSAVALSGEFKQHERTSALQALRDGRARVCVATDVAARGLDMPDLGLVIHADLPQNRAALLHRSGRTGRAGRKGLSVMLVPVSQKFAAERLLSAAKVKAVWSPAPSADQIRARDEENIVKEIVELAEAPADDDLAVAKALLLERSAEQLAALLVKSKRENLPAPEVIEDPGTYQKKPWAQKSRSRPTGPWVRDDRGSGAPPKKRWGASERPERKERSSFAHPAKERAERPKFDRTKFERTTLERPKFERASDELPPRRPGRYPTKAESPAARPFYEKAAKSKRFGSPYKKSAIIAEGAVERPKFETSERPPRPPRPRNKKNR